ncbi:MAG TPA: phage terminase large subunit [Azospirillaceae bacterium]|nr:phage terminase large subunit [Azospirillaceae bacterium]
MTALSDDRVLLNQILQTDLYSFVQRTFATVVPGDEFHGGWYLEAMCWHLEQAARGKIKRLLITLPPRHLKSICASVALPAWILGRDPTARILCVSYSQELANKLSRDCRAVMEAAWYRDVFGTRLDARKNTESEFATTRGGFRLSTSTGGTLTGRGGNFIILDDPMKAADALSEANRKSTNAWYDNTLYSRLDNKAEDVIVLVMQRLHMDDIVAHVLEQEDWVHLNLPAIAPSLQEIEIGWGEHHVRQAGELLHPEREPLAVLERMKRSLGAANFAAQYLQQPVPAEGAMIKAEWLRHYGPRDLPEGGEVYQSWDTASKAGELNDYSVCTTWKVSANGFHLVDVLRERLEFPALRRKAVELAERHAPQGILIEDKGSGTQLIQELRATSRFSIIPVTPEGDKVTRMHAQTLPFEAGRVWLPKDRPWLDDLTAELLAFPAGRHDDQVDSVSQFLAWITRREATGPRIRWL